MLIRILLRCTYYYNYDFYTAYHMCIYIGNGSFVAVPDYLTIQQKVSAFQFSNSWSLHFKRQRKTQSFVPTGLQMSRSQYSPLCFV